MQGEADERILIVDDDPGFRKLLETILRGEGYRVDSAGTVRDGIALAKRTQFRLALTDLKLPDGDGIQLLRWLREHSPDSAVIMITGFGTVSTAVEAMKLGAVDYLGKPLTSPDELRMLVRRTLEQQQVAHEHEVLAEEQAVGACGNLIAEDPAMRSVLALVAKVAPTEATVLITGESGTGKELIARCVHRQSARAGHVFVPVNCAALTPSLIESELFGHEKGAFTGAASQHQGRFERAHKGTIFLDEIGELDSNLQAKLLRVLQERTLERVGGSRQIDVDVRVVAATNRDLDPMVREGRFREDLFYRLNLFPIALPALRHHPADILPLARTFFSRARRRLGKPVAGILPETETALKGYAWPGNVRELENVMERAAILSEAVLRPGDLPHLPADAALRMTAATAHPFAATPGEDLVLAARTVRELEKEAILAALRSKNGNRTRAAAQLGISLRTLQYRLKAYGITGV